MSAAFMLAALALAMPVFANPVNANPVNATQADTTAELAARARIEILADDAEPWAGQILEVRVRLSLQRDFLRQKLVQSFRKKLGVPVQVRVPWSPELAGARALADDADRGDVSLVVNGQLAAARQVESAQAGFVSFEVARSFLMEEAGPLVLAPVTLRFEYAERFEESFLDGRVPLDPEQAVLESAPLSLDVRELPVVGRPAGFGGALGRFQVRAALENAQGVVGEPLTLTFTIEGEGNLAFLKAPAFDAELVDFHVRGRIDRSGDQTREVVHELVPLRVVDELPALAFDYFDPETEGYRVARSAPLALDIQPAADGAELFVTPRPADAGESEAPPEEPLEVPPAPRELGALMEAARHSAPVHVGRVERLARWPLASVLAAPWILWMLRALGVRLRARGREDAATRRARLAEAHFRARLATDGALSEAFAEYLGARLRCSAAAVVAADLPRRLETAGVESVLASEVAGVLRRLVDEHFARGQVLGTDTADLRRLVERLESCFDEAEVSR